MIEPTVMTLAVAGALVGMVLLGVTGRWRSLLSPFAIRAEKMTVERLDLMVTGSSIERVNTILRSFAGGFNTALTHHDGQGWKTYCASLPVLYQPFAHEGVAMGSIPRRLFRYDPVRFEEDLVRPRPEFRYLYYVGLGFWCGMRRYGAARVESMTGGLDPLHGYLVFDGYGFSRAFFHYRVNPLALRPLDAFRGYARNAAYQGVGRAFYFLYMDRSDVLEQHLSRLGDMAGEAAAGVGLATAFVNPDRLDDVLPHLAKLPCKWHRDLHLGLCFGLKARSINHLEWFEQNIKSLSRDRQASIRASIRECDRAELLIRDALKTRPDLNGYHQWRSVVTDWMSEHVTFPLVGLRSDRRVDDRVEPPVSAGAGSEKVVREEQTT